MFRFTLIFFRQPLPKEKIANYIVKVQNQLMYNIIAHSYMTLKEGSLLLPVLLVVRSWRKPGNEAKFHVFTDLLQPCVWLDIINIGSTQPSKR